MLGTARDLLVLSPWTGLDVVIGNGRVCRERMDKKMSS